MPDISMCENKGCSLKESCYRFKAIPDDMLQCYSSFEQDEDGNCEYFMKLYTPKDESKKD